MYFIITFHLLAWLHICLCQGVPCDSCPNLFVTRHFVPSVLNLLGGVTPTVTRGRAKMQKTITPRLTWSTDSETDDHGGVVIAALQCGESVVKLYIHGGVSISYAPYLPCHLDLIDTCSYSNRCAVWGRGTPLFPLSIYFLIFSPFYFSLSFIGFTYFLLLSIPSLSTRIVLLRFQAGGRRRRPNLGLVCVLLCNLCYLLVKMDCGVLFYLV